MRFKRISGFFDPLPFKTAKRLALPWWGAKMRHGTDSPSNIPWRNRAASITFPGGLLVLIRIYSRRMFTPSRFALCQSPFPPYPSLLPWRSLLPEKGDDTKLTFIQQPPIGDPEFWEYGQG
jgi:hypothetical protein